MAGYRRRTRRTFLATSLTAALGVFGYSRVQGQPLEGRPSISPDVPEMPTRQLGRMGVELPILGLGGAGPKTPLSDSDRESEAREQIQAALDFGIRYFDTASSYGPSESYLGRELPPVRNEIFLASKTASRDRDGAWRDLERSLRRLNTDYLDLWQLHHVSFERELDTIFGPNGAAKALDEAIEQGLVRFSGITGHHEPAIIAEGLRRYPFDHTLIPVNAADVHHPRAFIPSVLPVARELGVSVTAMKVPAYGRLLKPGVLDGMHQAFGYSLSQPGVDCAIVAAETIEQLRSNVEVAARFQQLDDSALTDIEQRTVAVWEDTTFFRAWT